MTDPRKVQFDLEDCLPRTLGVPGASLLRVESLPSIPALTSAGGGKIRVTAREVRIEMPLTASWRIVDGEGIEVAPVSPDQWIRTRCLTMSTPLCSLILQRGDLPLHAACLVPPNGSEALLLCAESGTGKSTTTVAAALGGWTVLADDITQVTSLAGIATALPGWATVKLWPDTCTLMGIPEDILPRSPALKDKRLWMPPRIGTQPARVSHVVILRRGLVNDGAVIERVEGVEAITLLKSQVFRPNLLGRIGDRASQIRRLVELASTSKVYRLDVSGAMRPEGVLESLERTIATNPREARVP